MPNIGVDTGLQGSNDPLRLYAGSHFILPFRPRIAPLTSQLETLAPVGRI